MDTADIADGRLKLMGIQELNVETEAVRDMGTVGGTG